MIVDPDFCDHWKTRLLVGQLDGDEAAPVYVLRLWSHCQNRRQDTFENLPAAALKALCRYPGHANKLESALLASGFVRREDSVLIVCNWSEYNASLIAAWGNGAKGGRPRKRCQKNPADNPAETHGFTIREDKRREEVVNTETQDAAASSVPVVSKTPRAKPFAKPTVSEVVAYVVEIGSAVDARQFVDYYEANGWRVGKNPMKDWRAAVRQWGARRKEAAGYAGRTGQHGGAQPTAAERRERLNASGFDWIEHAAAERERAEAAASGNGRGYLPAGD